MFEFVPQEPFGTVKEARDLLAAAGTEWDDGEGAKYGVHTGEGFNVTAAALPVDDEGATDPGPTRVPPVWPTGSLGGRELAGPRGRGTCR